MYSKVNYTIVGIFVVLFSIGMFWFAFWLAKYGLQEDYSRYKIETKDSIAGLSKDSSVKLHGVNIGRVSQIRINPKDIEKIDIYVDIKQDIPIKEDMIASTQMLGVTGLLSIEIHGGTNVAKTLVPTDTFIPTIASKPSLISKLTGNLEGLSEKLNSLLDKSQILLSNENLANIEQILENVKVLSERGKILEGKSIVLLDDFSNTLKTVNDELTKATADFHTMQKDFSTLKEVSVPSIQSIEKTSKNLNRLTLKIEKSLDRGDYSLKKILEPAVVDVRILVKQLGDVSKELEQNPSAILFKSRKSRRGPGE